MSKEHQQAIEILKDYEQINTREVIFYIAQHNPSVLVNACKDQGFMDLISRVIKEAGSTEKVPLIKAHRNITMSSLMEAKEWVEENITGPGDTFVPDKQTG